MKLVRTMMFALALAVMTGAASAETYKFYCNHCDAHIQKDGTGNARCCDCNKLNVLAACRGCDRVIAWKEYGLFNCPECDTQNAIASCIKCDRVAVAPSWTGWWTCPYSDCQASTWRYNCSGCHERFMSNRESHVCPDCD